MLIYIIDGYNLMFRGAQTEGELQKQRDKVIRDLNLKMGFLELKATLVFDAQYQEGETQRTHYDALEIVYTSHGVTADDCILEIVNTSQNPTLLTVITSDKKLAWFAKRLEAKVESVEQFSTWLTKRFHNKVRRSQQLVQKKELLPPPTTKKKKPGLQALPDDCMDYYLEMFDPHDSVADKKKGEIPKLQKKEKPLSDEERWLRAFELPPDE